MLLKGHESIGKGCSTTLLTVMELFCWNSHRLGNPYGVQILFDLLVKEDPDVIFLQETKVLASFFEFQKFYFGFSHCLVIDRVGQGGGLILIWKREVDLEILHFSS